MAHARKEVRISASNGEVWYAVCYVNQLATCFAHGQLVKGYAFVI